jgi:hypothetical protein
MATDEEEGRANIYNENGECMHCIAFNYWSVKNKKWKSSDLYLWAKDIGDARLKFFRAEDPRLPRRIEILAIGPVLGYHVHDNHGEKLSV